MNELQIMTRTRPGDIVVAKDNHSGEVHCWRVNSAPGDLSRIAGTCSPSLEVACAGAYVDIGDHTVWQQDESGRLREYKP